MLPIFGKIAAWAIKHAPEILNAVAIGGVIATGVSAAKCTPEAQRRISEIEFEETDGTVEIVVKKFKAAAPVYLPAVASGTLAIGCIIAGQTASHRRQAYLAGLAYTAEAALDNYKTALIEEQGVEAHHRIADNVARSKARYILSKSDEDSIECTGHGNTLFIDSQTGRMFRSDIEAVRQAEAEVAREQGQEVIVSLNRFYELNDLRSAKLGDKHGWDLSRHEQLEIFLVPDKHPTTEEPMHILDYVVYDLRRGW